MNARRAMMIVVLVAVLAAAGMVVWRASRPDSALVMHGAPRGAEAVKPADAPARESAKPLFEVADGRVTIPEFDDGRTSPTPVMALSPDDFEKPARVFRGRVILGNVPVASRPFTVPTHAKECVIRARAPQILDVFPRIRVSLESDDARSTVVLCERLVNHVTLQDIRCAMPAEAKKMFMGRIVIEQADKSFAWGWRSAFLAGVEFY